MTKEEYITSMHKVYMITQQYHSYRLVKYSKMLAYLFLVSLTVAVAVAVLAGLPESLTTTLSVYSLVVSADS